MAQYARATFLHRSAFIVTNTQILSSLRFVVVFTTRFALAALLAGVLAGNFWGCTAPKKITAEKPLPQPTPAPTVSAPRTQPAPSTVQPAPIAISPGLPDVPPTSADAPLHISVMYPVPGQLVPDVDSNFIFGAVGNGTASLTINGFPIRVAPNGAFLAFLPMPASRKYHVTATLGTVRDSLSVPFRSESASDEETANREKQREAPDKLFTPHIDTISKGSDTLQTGNDVAPGARTPDGNREWFFPRGTRLSLIAHRGKYYKVQLDSNTFAWVADSNFNLIPNNEPAHSGIHHGTIMEIRSAKHLSEFSRELKGDIFPSTGFVDLKLPGEHYPFQITANGTALRVHIYKAPSIPAALFDTSTNDPLIDHFNYDSSRGGVDFTVFLTKPFWGYKAFYTHDGSLEVRVRRPPTIDSANPLKGIRIMLDPGHPPGGATGPTGLMEREANLAEALKLRDQLIAKGAIVLMTHETVHGMVSDNDQTEELEARSLLGVQSDVDLYLSVHNNAFPDGTNPFAKYGSSTYYFHPLSREFAAELDKEIVAVTRIPDLGAKMKSLAVCRPTWMPCALTESLYLMFPDQENALRDAAFLDRLAAAHVRGIEEFLRERAK